MIIIRSKNGKRVHYFTKETHDILRSIQDVTEDTMMRDALAEIILDYTECPVKIIKCRPHIEDVIQAFYEKDLK